MAVAALGLSRGEPAQGRCDLCRRTLADIASQLRDFVEQLTLLGNIEGAYFFQFYAERPAKDFLGLLIEDKRSLFGVAGGAALMYRLFEMVDSAHEVSALAKGSERCFLHGHSQFLEVAVRNVVAAPVRNSIELDAVGELHLVLLLQPLEFIGSLFPASSVALVGGFAMLDDAVVGKLVRAGGILGVGEASVALAVGAAALGTPSSSLTMGAGRGPLAGDGAWGGGSCNGGGILEAGRGRNCGRRAIA